MSADFLKPITETFFFSESGIGLNTNKIFNSITGRTKVLKQRVLIEGNEDLMLSIQTKYSDSFFKTFTLDKDLHQDFFYFCQEDSKFRESCNVKTDAEILEFLKEKIEEYNALIQTEKK